MSGGHFDYAYLKVVQFADELGRDLREPKESLELNTFTTAKLHEIMNRAQEFAEIMREVEWFFSGDTGTKSMMERINEIENRE